MDFEPGTAVLRIDDLRRLQRPVRAPRESKLSLPPSRRQRNPQRVAGKLAALLASAGSEQLLSASVA
jgi:hypothetical protein